VSSGSRSDIIFDWNLIGVGSHAYDKPVQLLDETLRDGLQSPSVANPSIEDKRALLELMDQLGIQVADLGLPGAGLRHVRHVTALCQHLRDKRLKIRAAAAGRTLAADITPIIDISQTTGVEIEILTFLGASPIRTYTEGWTLDDMRRLTRDAVRLGVRNDLPVAFVTEDTARAHPEVLGEIFRVAIDEGAHRIIHCDTVGHATPDGVRALFDWTRELLERLGATHVGLDFHGHNDRGLALVNSLAAVEHGCDRLHGTALGLGERVGNTAMDLLLVNLGLMGLYDHDLQKLVPYCELAARATGRPIPHNYPVVGQDAFRTGTGVHAAAILKARLKGGGDLEDRIYSGVPAGSIGKVQVIEVGPMSGASNVIAWLATRGIPANPGLVAEIVRRAKRSSRTLTEDELSTIVQATLAATEA